MSYIENPKMRGSGMVAACPQTGVCPMRCKGCFAYDGRGYLEPLADNLPNLPLPADVRGRVVRMNDLNDSNHERDKVLAAARLLRGDGATGVFYNTSLPRLDFPGPVVLTANPGAMTDERFHKVDPVPPNLMFVRARANTWNTRLLDQIVGHYTVREVPVVLTMMAYSDPADVPEEHRQWYREKRRTSNVYGAVITRAGWSFVVERYRGNRLVYTCGRDADTHACRYCGVCLREWAATAERCRS